MGQVLCILQLIQFDDAPSPREDFLTKIGSSLRSLIFSGGEPAERKKLQNHFAELRTGEGKSVSVLRNAFPFK